MSIQTLDKASRIFLIGCTVAMAGIILYANKTQKEIDRLVADGEAKIKNSMAESDRLMEEVLNKARNTHI